MKNQILLLLFLILSASSIVVAQNKDDSQIEKLNFSGIWHLDKVSNNTILRLDKYTRWYEQKVTRVLIKHDEAKFSVSFLNESNNPQFRMEFFTKGGGETNSSPFRIYNTDKEKEFSEYLSFNSLTKQDGRTITSKTEIEIKLDGTTIPVIRVAEWKLSKDGKELIEKITLAKTINPGGAYNERMADNNKNIAFTRKYKLVE